ncbi:MAG: ATP-binding protein, partial [Angelakisella sp.]
MDRRKGFLLTSAALVLSAFICLMLYNFDNKYTRQAPQPISGVLFLSENDLVQTPVCFLIREWEFFPEVLLTPEKSSDYDGYRRYVDIGAPHGMMTHGSCTYRLTLMLPEHEATYALELPEIFSACRLFVDGEPMLELGEPSPEHYTEGIANRVVLFTAAGRTELLLNVSDFSGVYSGMTSPPAFGTVDGVLRQREIRLLLHGTAVLLALMG